MISTGKISLIYRNLAVTFPYSDTSRLFYQADLLLFHHRDLSSSLTYSNVQCVPIAAVDAIANVGTDAQPQLADTLSSWPRTSHSVFKVQSAQISVCIMSRHMRMRCLLTCSRQLPQFSLCRTVCACVCVHWQA